MTKAAIVGIAGPVLTPAEAALLAATPPAGLILFARNIETPAQVRALTDDLRRHLPPTAVLMVDQEGGRVARLKPPHWSRHPPASAIGALFATAPEAGLRVAWLTGALIGLDCAAAGLDVACAPVLDRRLPGANDAIGDRAYAESPETVAALGAAMADGLLAAGIQPVGKHAPGHGRAQADSHFSLPIVTGDDLDADLLPFAWNAGLPWMMTAHILYPSLDPQHPATLSPGIIAKTIRGRINFAGVLVSDDLAMQALTGTPAARARAALAAGCDLALYCPGDLAGNRDVLEAVPTLTGPARTRLAAARAMARHRRLALDPPVLLAERDGYGF